ncbi:hypothetical protein ACTOJF_004386, partial [Shigella flexneri]
TTPYSFLDYIYVAHIVNMAFLNFVISFIQRINLAHSYNSLQKPTIKKSPIFVSKYLTKT